MKEEMKLSNRLQAVADLVTKGNVVCDVGCDHGFVSIYLIQKGISPRVIAMDVNKGPLEAAREHIEACVLTDYIETRLSDGVEALQEKEADTLICAGMGGRLVIKILEEGKAKIQSMEELILQPQSELQYVREYLRTQGYHIVDENMILEEGKYYPMMKVAVRAGAVPSDRLNMDTVTMANTQWQRMEDKYGPILLKQKHPVLKEFLHREYGICEQILHNLQTNGSEIEERQQEIMSKMKDVEAALSYFENTFCE